MTMKNDIRRCRVCGCTEHDCSNCIERTGEAYRHAHLLNIPWMFAYMAGAPQTLYGRRVINNPDL